MRKHKKKVNMKYKRLLGIGLFVSLGAFLLFLTIGIYRVNAQLNDARPNTKMEEDIGIDGGAYVNENKKNTVNLLKKLLDFFDNTDASVPPETPDNGTEGDSENNPPTPTSPDVDTNPDSTPESSSPPPLTEEGKYADQVVQAFKNYCGGIVTTKNYACVDNIAPLLGKAAVTQLKSDMDNIAKYTSYLQCVNCARVMSVARGRPYTVRGDAKTHIPKLAYGEISGKNTSNYTYYSNTPENYKHLVPGSLGINGSGVSGHIFYITEVYGPPGNPDSYKAFECNYGPAGSVRHDNVRAVTLKVDGTLFMAGWQKPDNL